MRYRAVLFDMDGTVLDTLDDLASATNHSLEHFGFPAVSREKVAASLGNGAAHLIRCCAPAGTGEDQIQQMLAFYKPWYDAHCQDQTRPYPGILPLMERLRERGVKQAIISNKPDTAVQELAAQFFPGLLELALGESPRVRRKPNPDAVLAAAEDMGVPAADCVYVGDTEVDLETAKNAGMACIAVTWGFRSREQLLSAGATCLAETAEELEALL
ncbi:MAG: HAD family hydrolase [Oscillospiraceae bacterium]|nr:HAD family hydrolase [Oscillospiraceae bacterium]